MTCRTAPSWAQRGCFGYGVRALERGEDPFGPREPRVASSASASVAEVYSARPRIVHAACPVRTRRSRARGHRMGRRDLALVVLQNVGVGPLKDAGRLPPLKRAACSPSASLIHRLRHQSAERLVGEEFIERADRVRPAADTGEIAVGRRPSLSRICARAPG